MRSPLFAGLAPDFTDFQQHPPGFPVRKRSVFDMIHFSQPSSGLRSNIQGETGMMTARRIVNYMTAEPFQPFRIKMASGEALEIRHPEMILVGRTTATVSTWTNEQDDPPSEREQEISILLIESIELLKQPAESNKLDN